MKKEKTERASKTVLFAISIICVVGAIELVYIIKAIFKI